MEFDNIIQLFYRLVMYYMPQYVFPIQWLFPFFSALAPLVPMAQIESSQNCILILSEKKILVVLIINHQSRSFLYANVGEEEIFILLQPHRHTRHDKEAENICSFNRLNDISTWFKTFSSFLPLSLVVIVVHAWSFHDLLHLREEIISLRGGWWRCFHLSFMDSSKWLVKRFLLNAMFRWKGFLQILI